ncbi:Wzz/FepE/Etk N-terminal domain-containing protein [Poseidonocella sp. HB161398]|uniref:GumC family protein n=1 Tax=Poseidonocella sp. HB161398 TaxID=2320855 RepID=UPI00110857C7|nr:Wzz/FepE/Etk N-terminal domain-containing protein [Poseidonocella sp. HB161398]
MRIDFSYYISIFWRRFHYFLVIVVFFAVLGSAVAIVMPPEYSATARLLVESPQISDKLAESTVNVVAQEQLQVIEQRVMARASLVDLASKLEVFPDEDAMTATDIVNQMRDRTKFTIFAGRNQATFVDVAFRGSNPDVVARVANELVTQILNENVRMRTVAAGDTMDFFKEEVDRLSGELDRQSAKILDFKSANAGSLPENRDYLSSRQTALAEAIRNLQDQIDTLTQQRQAALDLFAATGSVGTGRNLGPDEQALAQARDALDNALIVYAPDHPRIKVLEARVRQLEARVGVAAGAGDEGPKAVLDAQLAQVDHRLEQLQGDLDGARAELENVTGSLSQMPATAVALDGYTRDYENTQEQYRSAVARLSAAETGERIELGGKSQRISVVEQATRPMRPSKPNRPLIAAAGLGVGLSMGFGFIVLLELLNRSIRRPVEISDKLGIATFAVIPLIRTEQETRWRRMFFFLTIILLFLAIPLSIWAIHMYVVPLNVLAEDIARKFGMDISLK